MPSPHDPTIPVSQQLRINQIREVHWESLEESLDDIDDAIAKRARKAMAKIRASNYSPRVIREQTRAITAHTSDITVQALSGQIEAAALYAQRAADVIRAWEISGRIKDGVEHLTVSDSAFARATRPGVSAIDAEASLARIKTSVLRTPAEQRKALESFGAKQARATYTGPSTSGTRAMDALRKVGLVKKSSEIGLSERLHGSAARNIKETEKAIGTAIREAKNMNRAGRDLINAIGKGGNQLSVNRGLTKPLMRLKRAGRKLQLLSINKSDPDALKAATKEYKKSFAQIKKIAASRVDARGSYIETVEALTVKPSYRALRKKKAIFDAATKKQVEQWVTEESAKRTDKALGRWLQEGQSYNSERIVETETAGAYRSREAQQVANRPYVTGFWWRRSAGMLSLDKKRTFDIKRSRRMRRKGKNAKRKTKGRPCRVCPVLADNWYPKEYAQEYPRGAHSHCRCHYVYTYSKDSFANQPVTQSDLDWYDSLPG